MSDRWGAFDIPWIEQAYDETDEQFKTRMKRSLYEYREKIAGPFLLKSTGREPTVGDTFDLGEPPWRRATVVAVESFNEQESVFPVYVVDWKVIGEVPEGLP